MTDSLPCPGCHTPLPPEATGCQICMRARSKQEIVRGYAKLRESKARRQRLPLKIAAFLLVGGAALKLGWGFRAAIRASAGSATRRAAAWYDQFTDAKSYAPRDSVAAADAAAAAGVPKSISPLATPTSAPPELLDERPQPGPSPSAPPRAEPVAAPPAAKPPVAKNAWRVSGVVYDLSTLQPVSDSELTFFGDKRATVTVKTGPDGTYEADLAKVDGWTVSMVSGQGWRTGQILDVDPPYRQRDVDERSAALEHLSDGDLAPAPVGWKRSASKVRLDLVAVPVNFPHRDSGR